MHVNSTVGLFPEGASLDEGQVIAPSKSQRWLIGKWKQYWQDVEHIAGKLKADKITTVINGDWGDKNRHSSFQLIEPENDSIILDWMRAVMYPARKLCEKRIFVVRGTEAHTGGSGWLENEAAKGINAQINDKTGQPSFWVLRLNPEGVRILFAHHPMTNGRVKWTNGSAANRAAASVALDYYNEPERPDLAIFGHVHHSEDSYDNQPVRVVYSCPWCLVDNFTHRIGEGLAAIKVGGLIVAVEGDRFRVYKAYYDTPAEDRQWIKI